MANKEKRPQGFVIYAGTLKFLTSCTPDEVGRAVIAGANLFLTGEYPSELDRATEIVFKAIKVDIDTALAKYEATCIRNKHVRPPEENNNSSTCDNSNDL